jgi:hypothetical protein
MRALAESHSLCRYEGERLVPCQYHRDRMNVGLYEKPGYDGETELSETQVRLTPEPQLLELLEKMRDRTQVAGHWGLMKGHRDWIAAGLCDSLARREGRVRILQCGIAGPVHYFANLAILTEQLDRPVTLSTRDLCVGSTRPIQGQLERMPRDPRVEHDLALEDLSAETWTDDPANRYDVVLSHHLLSMWGNETGKVERLCKNLGLRTGIGADLYFAMSTDRIDRTRISLIEYHRIFMSQGFEVADERLVWDVYDLDQETVEDMLLRPHELDVVKDCALVHYVRVR